MPPYSERYGGVVLSTTIDKYAYCTVTRNPKSGYSLRSADQELLEIYPNLRSLKYNGKLDLGKAVIKTVRGPGSRSLEMSLLSEAPPGSGLGSSSALMVSAIRAVSDFLNMHKSSYSIAELAFELERNELGIKGGYQDQFASTFGGFNFMEFGSGGVKITPLRLKNEILQELLLSLVLIDTGRSRLSSNILSRQINSYLREDALVMENLAAMKQLTVEMKTSLLQGDIAGLAELVGKEWVCKKRLDKMITNSQIDTIYKNSLKRGAMGGKVLGAGDGGHMLFFVDFKKKRELTKYLASIGNVPISFNFDDRGVCGWKVENNTVLV